MSPGGERSDTFSQRNPTSHRGTALLSMAGPEVLMRFFIFLFWRIFIENGHLAHSVGGTNQLVVLTHFDLRHINSSHTAELFIVFILWTAGYKTVNLGESFHQKLFGGMITKKINAVYVRGSLVNQSPWRVVME